MDILPIQDKRYTASFRLGLTTDTQDITGTVQSESPLPVSREALEQALVPLRGSITQLPPMYSAVSVGGRRLYDLARRGEEVERPTRQVTLYSLTLLSYDPATRAGVLDAACSKGTYIRTLIHDLGEALGCGGVLAALRRTETLGYTLDRCYTLAQLQELAASGTLSRALLSPQSAFATYPKVCLDDVQAKLFLNGVRLELGRIGSWQELAAPSGPVTVWQGALFLGIATADPQTQELVLGKLFHLPNQQ